MQAKNATRKTMVLLMSGAIGFASVGGCENLPGEPGTQGAVIGGIAGGAAGAAIADDNRLIGGLIGAAIGAGGGYLIGANMDKIRGDDEDDARQAVERAQRDPATAADVRNATTADLNNDGFVTLDEVVAMDEAGLSDQQMLNRLEATNQIFELTEDQQQYLLDRGVSTRVVYSLNTINQDLRQELLDEQQIISETPRN